MFIHIFYIKQKRGAIVFVFAGAGGGSVQTKKKGSLESTPKLIELKHFKKSNSSRNDTINAVEGSDEMNQ